MEGETQARSHAEFVEKVHELIHQYRAALAPTVPMPVVLDWVLVASIDSVADRMEGAIVYGHPGGQWTYRTEGLLLAGVRMVGQRRE